MMDGRGGAGVRNRALDAVLAVFRGDAFSTEALDALPGTDALSDTDRRFLRRLVKGTLSRRYTLEAVLERISSTPPEKMKPVVRALLCLGVYELYYLRTASFAAVHQYVELAGRRNLHPLKGFVNAVLRRADRERETVLSALSVSESLGYSAFLYGRMCAWYGADAAAAAGKALFSEEQKPVSVLRMQSRIPEDAFLERLRAEGAEAVPTGLCAGTYRVASEKPLSSLDTFRDGYFYIQDVSSALAGEAVKDLLLAAGDGYRVLDVCASPGGKSIHAADLMLLAARDHGTAPGAVISCDISEAKTRRILENAERLRLTNLAAAVRDASVYAPEEAGKYDLVLADVPCSGIGIIGRKPDIQYHLSQESFDALQALQLRILTVSAGCVRPGGTLVYSTCTLNPGENRGTVGAFLSAHPDFRPEGFSGNLAEPFRRPEADEGYLTLLPGRDPCQGFFIARLKRDG